MIWSVLNILLKCLDFLQNLREGHWRILSRRMTKIQNGLGGDKTRSYSIKLFQYNLVNTVKGIKGGSGRGKRREGRKEGGREGNRQ